MISGGSLQILNYLRNLFFVALFTGYFLHLMPVFYFQKTILADIIILTLFAMIPNPFNRRFIALITFIATVDGLRVILMFQRLN